VAAHGAIQYARREGFSVYNPVTEARRLEWEKQKGQDSIPHKSFGTVGAVSLDTEGKLAAATSTGGKGMEVQGRVSDSATVAGTYASKKAAVSATGEGEEIVEMGLAVRIVTRVDDGKSLSYAFKRTFQEFQKNQFKIGAIGVDIKGKVAIHSTTACILHCAKTPKRLFGYP